MKIKSFAYLTALSVALVFAVGLQAQDTSSAGKDLERAGQKATRAVEKTAKKVGNKTAEIASKSKSAVVDRTYDGKRGPNGEKVFIDGKSQYYIIDKKGKKKYIDESKLVDSPK